MSKTCHGSCICGAVKFEADVDMSKSTGKCNCSICGKLRFWGMHLNPSQFRLVPPSAVESQLMTDYTLKNPEIHNLFCKKCGAHAYHRGNLPQLGGEIISINVACLDDIQPSELAALGVRYADGRNDNWWNEPAEKQIL